jgi:hypothetical protein
MFRRIAGIIGVAAAALGMLAVNVGPASASTTRMMSVWGSVHIEDYETFAANEHCYSSLNWNATASTAYPISGEWIRTCGGEIRAELHLEAQVVANSYLHVYGTALFYEGTSTSTGDLDGSKTFSMYIAPGHASPLTFTVWNTDEGDCDCAYYNLSVGNYTP